MFGEDQKYPCTASLPVFCAVSAELGTLLWWKFDNNEAIDASFLAVLDNSLLAVAADGVEVSHENDGGLEALGSCFPDHVQAHWNIYIVFKSNLYSREKTERERASRVSNPL